MNGTTQVVELSGADYEHTMTLDGIRDGIEIRYTARSLTEVFGRMIAERAYEACEFSLANYILLKDRGADWLFAIPVFPYRDFRHNTLFVRRDSDLVEPAQLRGKRIGVEDYSMTAAVWLRGFLNEEYGVNWRELEWHCDARQPRFTAPPEVKISLVSDDLESMLLEGKLDAIMSFGPRDERLPADQRQLRRLIPDAEAVEREYYRRTGIYPINHCVVIRKDVLDRAPDFPQYLFGAYAQSKASAYKRKLGATLVPWGDRRWKELFDFFDGDPLPYGLTKVNRKVIAKLAEYLHEQKWIAKLPDIDSLFIAGSAEFRQP